MSKPLGIYRRLGLGHEKSVYRIDQEEKGTHGWNVAVTWERKRYTKFFADTAYGRKVKVGRKTEVVGDPVRSYKAAVEFRNRLEDRLGKPRTNRMIISGATGITRRETRSGPVYEVWWLPKPGVVARTSVSIHKYGERKAKQRALEIRRRAWVASIMGVQKEQRRVARKARLRLKLRRRA